MNFLIANKLTTSTHRRFFAIHRRPTWTSCKAHHSY